MKKNLQKILIVGYLVVFIALVIASIVTKDEILLISTSVALAILVLLNLRYIIINQKKIRSINFHDNEVTKSDLHPLELYLIDCIWNHKKKRFNKNQIYGAVLYELEVGHLVQIDKGITISKDIDLEKISIYSLITIEMALLENIDCRKNKKLKLDILKKIQKENILILTENFHSNISDNCLDRNLFYEQVEDMKKMYFNNIEDENAVYLTIVSWVSVILSSAFIIMFYNEASLFNFYLPICLAVLLVGTITSNYRERVTIKNNYNNFINESLNYINYLKNYKKSRINDIYAYCLGINKNKNIINVFNE